MQGDCAKCDILGHIFEYFLGEFALSEGKKGGQFYTPKSVVASYCDARALQGARV
nr:N-6 DNA methylase [Helicobacter himalayensis]